MTQQRRSGRGSRGGGAGVLCVQALCAWLALGPCAATADPPSKPRNLLLLIADDVGIDLIAPYGLGNAPGRTPNLDALFAQGVRFRNVWSYPSCSPARAAMLTGLPAHRNGVGATVHPSKPWAGLDPALPTVAKRLKELGYHTFATGKWHLGPTRADPGFRVDHPREVGFDSFAGSLGNIASYHRWRKIVNGVDTRNHSVYATTDTVNETLAHIRSAKGPWFGWVAFHAMHQPWSDPPPPALHSYTLTEAPGAVRARAILEALDAEIGRLLAGIPEAVRRNTTIVFTSDNGTPGGAIESVAAKDHGKFTMYEFGLRVPLVVVGPDVSASNAGREADSLVHVTDLSATLVELAGGDAETEDSRSLVPYLGDPSGPSKRSVLISEKFKPNGIGLERKRSMRAIRNTEYKLIARKRKQEFYDLRGDDNEALMLAPDALTPDQVHTRRVLSAGLDAIDREEAEARESRPTPQPLDRRRPVGPTEPLAGDSELPPS